MNENVLFDWRYLLPFQRMKEIEIFPIVILSELYKIYIQVEKMKEELKEPGDWENELGSEVK